VQGFFLTPLGQVSGAFRRRNDAYALDNGQRSRRKLLRAVVGRLLGPKG
jgi:hypothetical protein